MGKLNKKFTILHKVTCECLTVDDTSPFLQESCTENRYVTLKQPYRKWQKCLLLFLLSTFFQTHAQVPIEMGAFLATVKTDTEVQLYKEKLDFFNQNKTDLPLIEEVELRVSTNKLNPFRNDYGVRVSPNGLRQKREQKAVQLSIKKQMEAEQQLLFQEKLKERYFLIIHNLFQPRILELKKKIQLLNSDKRLTYRRLLENSFSFDVNDLVETEEEQQQLALELLGLKKEIDWNLKLMQKDLQRFAPISLITTHLVDAQKIASPENLKTIAFNSKNVYFQHAATDIELAQNEYELEKAKTVNPVSFLQLSYEGERGPIRDVMEISAGIKAPLAGSAKIKFTELQVKQLEAEHHLQLLQEGFQEQKDLLVADLSLLHQKYLLLQAQKRDDPARNTLERYLQIEGIPPLTLLELQENILKKDLLLLETEYEIYLKYIDLLDITGRLAMMPLRNYLSTKFELF